MKGTQTEKSMEPATLEYSEPYTELPYLSGVCLDGVM